MMWPIAANHRSGSRGPPIPRPQRQMKNIDEDRSLSGTDWQGMHGCLSVSAP
ncbi:MAG: hypothetical protein ACI8WM_002980 [Burkholderiaceae bacterium]|jgi:hypothetical protein